MEFLANAKALFVGLRESKSYHEAIQVAAPKKAELLDAQHAIRQAIRDSASRIRTEDQFWDNTSPAHRTYRTRPDVMPKFFTQGSFAYGLLIDPAHKPRQQIDLDDGMYVGVDFLKNGRPALVAKGLFQLVEDALAPLCQERGWTLDKSKQTCVRIKLDEESHIDIPIYSAPREQMIAMDSVALSARADSLVKRAGHQFLLLPSDQIMLAHRNGNWDQSDPLAISEWVNDCVTRYGEMFRRTCRYAKGWRDYRWPQGCLTSITIMAAIAEALEEMNGTHRELDDDRLMYEVARRLPKVFENDIYNPALPGRSKVLNDWTSEERREVVRATQTLAEHMHSALKGTFNADLVVKALREAFGDRIPNRPDVVKIMPPVATTIAAEAAVAVPAPRVTSSTSG